MDFYRASDGRGIQRWGSVWAQTHVLWIFVVQSRGGGVCSLGCGAACHPNEILDLLVTGEKGLQFLGDFVIFADLEHCCRLRDLRKRSERLSPRSATVHCCFWIQVGWSSSTCSHLRTPPPFKSFLILIKYNIFHYPGCENMLLNVFESVYFRTTKLAIFFFFSFKHVSACFQ